MVMKDNDDDIQFETMPDFGNMFLPKNEMPKKEKHVEKEYDTLYDELLDKCYPGNYKDDNTERFDVANDIYDQLKLKGTGITDDDLRYLRNRAIEELSIHISTSKTFAKLKSLIDPENYIKIEPYNKGLVEKAKRLYDQLKKDEDDIRALERIENHTDTNELIEEYYYNILSPNEYLKKCPTGKHSNEVKELLLKEEEKYYNDNIAKTYLEKYPNGIHKDEAECYNNESPSNYLKKYPNGRYQTNAKEDRKSNIIGICFAIVMIGGVVLVIIGSYLNH